jgi:hypothetical protein
VTDGPARGWLHTHGLAAHGKPELEIRDVPLFLGAVAGQLLNDLAGHLLNDAAVALVPGELVQWGRRTILLAEGRPDEDGGYDPAHYATPRIALRDPPDGSCACDECARERSSSLPH